MIKTMIIDDEPKAKENLLFMLNKYCEDIFVCATASNFEEAYHLVKEHQPQLLFTDINLNSVEGNGIELVQFLNSYFHHVIFISGWREHAVEAFRVNAVDYLLKPINIQQLIDAVHKVRSSMQLGSKPLVNDYISNIHIPTQHGFIIIKQQNIIRCEAEGPYTHFYLIENNRKITSSINLGQIETRVRKDMFFRIHKSHLINMNYILEYKRGDGGVVKMKDQHEIPVSRSLKENFLKWLEEKTQ